MTDNLAAALVAFQGMVPAIPKNRTAKMGTYSYRYADLADMWDAIREPLHTNGLAVTQPLVAASTAGLMAIKTIIWHTSGQKEEEVFEFPAAGRTAQEIGSQITYMRRYALGSALGLSTDDDDDGNAASRAKTEPRKPQPAKTPAEVARVELAQVCKDGGLDLTKVGERFATEYGRKITEADVSVVRAFTAVIAEEIAVDKAAS